MIKKHLVEENASPLRFEDRLDVQPEEGMLVMFPGILDHRVKPTEGRRVCAAMNLHKLPVNFEKAPTDNINN